MLTEAGSHALWFVTDQCEQSPGRRATEGPGERISAEDWQTHLVTGDTWPQALSCPLRTTLS